MVDQFDEKHHPSDTYSNITIMTLNSNDDMKKSKVEHVEDATSSASIDKSTTNPPVVDHVNEDVFFNAENANRDEHSLGVREAIKVYKSSIFWAVVMSATIIMEGYDNILMSSFFAYPSFKKKYGHDIGGGNFELSSSWQVALNCGSSVGSIIGNLCNGYIVEKFGHRHVAMVNLIIMACFIFIPFFANTVSHLLAGQILCGLTWGVFASLGPMYSSEIMPLVLRGYLSAYVNLCWATGQFIAAGVLKGLVNNTTQWSFRIPFAIQWVWVPILFTFSFFAPDSPQWLIRKGKRDQALKSMKRLSHKSIHFKAHERIAMMVRTNELEKEQERVSGDDTRGLKAYVQCFKGTNLRRTEIACIAFAGQVLSGSTFAYSPSYFFSQAGMDSDRVYKLNLGVTGIAFTGCICSWFLLNRFGRRTIYVTGYAVLTAALLLIGILASVPEKSGLKWAQAAITMVWVATYALSIGPLAFTIVGEMSSTRVRSQSIGLARSTYSVVALLSNVIEPYLINPTSANLKGKTAYVWLGTAVSTLTWSYFRLPETKDRTYEELDILFEKKLPARKFASYQLNLTEELVEEHHITEVK